MKSILIQWSAVFALLGLLSISRTVASEKAKSDDIYSESIYIDRPRGELPSSIDDPMSSEVTSAKLSQTSRKKQ